MKTEHLKEIRKLTEDLAPILMNYFLELKNVGFTDSQALSITMNFQRTLIGPRSND